MKGITFIIAVTLVFFTSRLMAQSDAYSGTWLTKFESAGKPVVSMELKIASPERNLLYPAQISLQCDSFSAVYQLLLVKKNSRQLAIGKNKAVISETAFSLGAWTILLNGTFDLGRDNKGISYLSPTRIAAKKYGVDMPELSAFKTEDKSTAALLNSFLKEADIKLKKINQEAWTDPASDLMLDPSISNGYFGIADTVHVQKRSATLSFPGNKKSSNGIVSVMLNGRSVVDQAYLSERRPFEEIILDTGLNILAFFAEEYGNVPANTGALEAETGSKKISLDFGNKRDMAATFIVAKIYYDAPADTMPESDFQHNMITRFLENNISDDVKVYRYPDKERKEIFKNDSARKIAEATLLRDAKLVGNMQTRSGQILLAFWDDALEDGDSISLSINGHWIVQGLAVKKKPQFIYVTLEPGPNNITFVAENLGSIIPNTSVLEIIDGRQRKSFMIDTDLTRNNLIKIAYEFKPGG